MNSKSLFFTSIWFMLLCSCNEDQKLIFVDSNFNTQNNKLVDVFIPTATGDKNIVESINSIVSNEVVKMLQIGNSDSITSKTIEEAIDAFNNEYNNFNTSFPETSHPWEAQIDGEVMYQSPEIISMSLTSYLFTGGAHGNLTIYFLNFDTKTGKLIKTEDLFKNMNDFNKIAKTYFENSIETKEILFDPESIKLPENIGFNDEGAVLLYNPYEIAPYSTGIIEFNIPFEELNSILNFDSPQ